MSLLNELMEFSTGLSFFRLSSLVYLLNANWTVDAILTLAMRFFYLPSHLSIQIQI